MCWLALKISSLSYELQENIMSNKKYTREQIEKAIDFWTRQMNIMQESKSRVIDALIAEFGENVVCSKDMNYQLSDKDLRKIFDILNAWLFNSQLKDVPIKYWPESKIVDKMNYHLIESEVFSQKYTNAPCYGVHSAICKNIKNSQGDVIDINIYDDIILINSTFLTKCIFIFAVAVICHEMIHYYDRFSDEYHDKALSQSKSSDIEWEAHNDKRFVNKMNEALANGIDVIIKPKDNDTFWSLNYHARYVLEQVLDEDDSSIITGVKTDNLVVLRTKGSDKFVVTHFD